MFTRLIRGSVTLITDTINFWRAQAKYSCSIYQFDCIWMGNWALFAWLFGKSDMQHSAFNGQSLLSASIFLIMVRLCLVMRKTRHEWESSVYLAIVIEWKFSKAVGLSLSSAILVMCICIRVGSRYFTHLVQHTQQIYAIAMGVVLGNWAFFSLYSPHISCQPHNYATINSITLSKTRTLTHTHARAKR